MADWAAALAQGISGAAGAEAGIADNQIRINQQMDAEQRAADMRLSLQARLDAATQMRKQAAMQRFQNYLPPDQQAAAAQAGAQPSDGTTTPAQPGAATPNSANSANSGATPGAPSAAGSAAVTSPMSKWDRIKAGLQAAAIEDPEAAQVAGEVYAPMMERDAKDADLSLKGTDLAQKAKHDDRNMTVEEAKAAEQVRHNKADEKNAADKNANDAKDDKDKLPASVRMALINSKNADIKSSTSELTMLSRELAGLSYDNSASAKARKDEINQRMEAVRGEIADAKAEKNAYMKSLNLGGGGKADDMPEPAAPAAPASGGAVSANKKKPAGLKADPLRLF